jgi:hypothetical protein
MRNSIGRATIARRNIVGGGWLRLGKIIFSVFIFDRSESKFVPLPQAFNLRVEVVKVASCWIYPLPALFTMPAAERMRGKNPWAINLRVDVTKLASCAITGFHDLLNNAGSVVSAYRRLSYEP